MSRMSEQKKGRLTRMADEEMMGMSLEQAEKRRKAILAAAEAACKVFEGFMERARPFLAGLMAYLCIVYVALQRIQIQIVLVRRWHIPAGMAYWLAERYPRRWLPKLKPELWENEITE